MKIFHIEGRGAFHLSFSDDDMKIDNRVITSSSLASVFSTLMTFATVIFQGGLSDRLFDLGLCLPSGSNLSIKAQDRVIDCIKHSLKKSGDI